MFKPSQKSYETTSIQSLSNEKPREIWTPNLSSIPILESLNVIFMSSIDTACILLKEDEKKNHSKLMRAFDSIILDTPFLPQEGFFGLRIFQKTQMPHNWLPKPLPPRLNLNFDRNFGSCLDYEMLAKITV